MFKEIGITAIVNLMEENLYNPTHLGFSYLHKGFPDDTYPPHDIVLWVFREVEVWLLRGC